MNRFGDIDSSFKRLPPVYGYRSEKLVSIEKALEPIQPYIDELPYYIKIAKRNCHFPSEHELSRDQSAAVYIYTMEWGETTLYRVLNTALRSENRKELKIWFPYLKLFDTALDKLPTVKEVVWRGVPLDIGKNFKRNQTFTWWSISSCSCSVNVIKDFLDTQKRSTLFLIEAINGKKVSGYTEYESEEEIILRLGTEFRVKGDPLDQGHGSHVVHLVEIDDNDDQALTTDTNSMDLHEATKPLYSSTASSGASSSIKVKPTPVETKKKLETPKPKYQEFAAPGACKALDCEGRPCANCGKCRDWHFTGDQATWDWICGWENWKDEDWKRWYDGAWKLFTKRDGATCYYRYHICLCERH